MLPYFNTEHTLRLPFVVAPTKTIHPGMSVKISNASPADPNTIEIEEALLGTDQGIGIAQGAVNADNPDGPFAAGSKVNVIPTFVGVVWAIAGTAGVTMGKRVKGSSTGLVDAPVPAASGATVNESPGIALSSGASGEAFSLALQPSVYIST